MPSKASGAVTSEEATGLFIDDRIEVRGTRDFRRRRVPSVQVQEQQGWCCSASGTLYSASTRTTGKTKWSSQTGQK